ncbi:hypothetical protein C2G38_2048187 [Gigaspora rosea]|uniref:Cytochrome b5 heme-binding domain-containing protein n=1 Tax=Gigaspora rosea TaxID=44941 RepID=A0A397UC96_9GLOM|nr:hypothetical protein C2G38_2048187 [Gigaspora rosea]
MVIAIKEECWRNWKTKGPVRLVLNSKASKEIEWHWQKKLGGIDINAESEVRDMQEQVIPGLFASGEIAGGVRANRLGGFSLLGCVVYGRVAGDSASRYLFANRRLGQIAGQLAPYQTTVSVDPTNQKSDCWVIVNGEVLNVTNFLPDHPGGKKAILIYAGKDATEEFNMLHDKGVVQKYSPEATSNKMLYSICNELLLDIEFNVRHKIKSNYVERIFVRSTPSKCISTGLLAKESKNYV